MFNVFACQPSSAKLAHCVLVIGYCVDCNYFVYYLFVHCVMAISLFYQFCVPNDYWQSISTCISPCSLHLHGNKNIFIFTTKFTSKHLIDRKLSGVESRNSRVAQLFRFKLTD